MRTAHLVRRNWRATVFLALLAGLAGGVAMGAWAAGRRTSTAFDRLVEYARLPDLNICFCPPTVTDLDEEAVGDCLAYIPEAELETIRRLPEVESAWLGAFRGLTFAPVAAPSRTRMAGGMIGQHPPASGTVLGRPLVVAGRLYRVESADEVVITEFFRDRFDVTVGDELVLSF